MVTLPPQFIAIKYPGYFWNEDTQTLFTAKLGVLRELTVTRWSPWNCKPFHGYRISHNGIHRNVPLSYLQELKPKDSTFPMTEEVV